MGCVGLQKEALSASLVSRAGSDPLQTASLGSNLNFHQSLRSRPQASIPPLYLGKKKTCSEAFMSGD